ncbi:4-coumarate--CoA ligase-like 7 [Selaginella moellendorffii]|uniref:4-coumarate--CoA ligase-like 7 n=1 Tax=Selaginella moellendorffii TaxID=88036 RepID=UPI000D1C9A16|nr:4-coumarate--CoA ligase-like 7 [Selaginella moellendorffii]|eukprot:XP_024514741.1 4-coumarate--CoA ligase-like 7 [Selaginella moellendorffii]
MARSGVLRRCASGVANWRRQSIVAGASLNLPSFSTAEQGSPPLAPRHGAVARFLGFQPGGIALRRNLCTGTTLGSAAAEECINAAPAPAPYSPATGTYSSARPPLKMPEDPCMDVTTFVMSGKDNLADKPALIDAKTGHTITYSQLQHAICSVELGLVSIGVRQGDVVMLVSRNSVHYPVAFLATTSVGGVLATLNPLTSAAEAKKQAEAAGARFVIVEEEFVDKVAELGVPLVIIEKGDKIKVGSTEVAFSDLLASDPSCSSAPETKISQDDPALVLYSAGTTGPSKGVVLSHKNIIAQLLQLSVLGETDAGTHLCCLPMSHVFGLVVITLQQLYRGATVVVMPKLDMNDAPNLISAHKVTHLYALPNTIAGLLKIMTTSTSPGSFSSLQRVLCGGAPLRKEVIEEFCKQVPDASFVQVYGLTEATGAVALNNLKEDQFPDSVGTLLSGIEAKILNGDKEPLGPNNQGELHVRGPNVMKGYFKGVDETLDRDGWLSTGDLVSFDEEGRMFVIDRIKDKSHQSSG